MKEEELDLLPPWATKPKVESSEIVRNYPLALEFFLTFYHRVYVYICMVPRLVHFMYNVFSVYKHFSQRIVLHWAH